MGKLEPIFIERLIEELARLPDRTTQKERHQSWMTAEQILEWWKTWSETDYTVVELDKELRGLWSKTDNFPLRPAKYPSRIGISRLWGHIKNVTEGPSDIRDTLMGVPLEFEGISLNADAPTVFVSHSFHDVHLASRIRLLLSLNGLRAWLAEAELETRGLIFEGVKEAVDSSAAVVGIFTKHSICAPWFITEIFHSSTLGKPVILAVDSTDKELMSLLSKWKPGEPSTIDQEALLTLKNRVQGMMSGGRYENYIANALHTLEHINEFGGFKFELTIYPRRKTDWQSVTCFKDFDSLIEGLAKRVLSDS